MSAPSWGARQVLERILRRGGSETDLVKALSPRPPEGDPLPPRLPESHRYTGEAVARRREVLEKQGIRTDELRSGAPGGTPEQMEGHIENFIGFAKVPVGVIGPLRINGTEARGDFYVPLATTEGALVASYNRGAWLTSQAGGATAMCLTEAVSRAPCFVFERITDVGRFLAWVLPRFERFHEIVGRTSKHCRLIDMRTSVLGREVYLIFMYSTGDAAGQNMVTFATEAICEELAKESPVKPTRWYLEGNMSGDKKATMLAFTSARGKKVVAEATIPRKILRRYVHADPVDLHRYWQVSTLGGVQSGSIGVQGHFANALAAIFIACGQDAACVSEASVGLTRMDVDDRGDLYVSVSLPGLIVGTIGGGTTLPTARECLEMMGCAGEGRARKFAEICAAVALAGEISIIGSLAAGDFAKAHSTYGRKSGRSKG